MSQYSDLIVKTYGNGISRVIINSPNTYNALSINVLKSLLKCFKKFNNDKKTKVIVLEGAGKGFSAGHNLKEVKALKGKPEV